MAVYYKPQSPIQSGEDFIYPITTADQVMVDENTRLNAVGVYLKNIDNSTDTTVYGNNATTLGGVAAEDYALKTDTAPDSSKLGGVAASDYALKTDTAPDSSKLGGKSPEYYIQPRNLLDNSDFRNPVNQRGNTEITGDWNYGIDRWLVSTKYEQNPNGSILIADNGLSMGYWTDMMQLIPFEQIKGKTLTFAVCTENGVYAYTMTLPESAPPAGSGSIFVGDGIWNDIIVMESIKYDNNDSVMFRFRNARTTNQLVYWAALYEGSYTVDTLPPYVPKGYAAELAECQRYFWICANTYHSEGVGYAFNSSTCRVTISTPQTFRIIPSLTSGNGNTTNYGIRIVEYDGHLATPTAVNRIEVNNNRIALTLGGSFTAGKMCTLRIENSFIAVSADL